MASLVSPAVKVPRVVTVGYFPLHKAQQTPCTTQYALSERLKVPTQITIQLKEEAYEENNFRDIFLDSSERIRLCKGSGPIVRQ